MRKCKIFLYSKLVHMLLNFPNPESSKDLVICRVDKSSGKARGKDEVFLLCDKVNKGLWLSYTVCDFNTCSKKKRKFLSEAFSCTEVK